MYDVIYFWTERGEHPVKEFICFLQNKSRVKVARTLLLLATQGPFLKRPYADKVRGEIYELRVRFGTDQIRVLYAFILNRRILLLHIFRKKTDSILLRDLELAENRLRNFRERYDEEV